jgi:PEP-CTERM motif
MTSTTSRVSQVLLLSVGMWSFQAMQTSAAIIRDFESSTPPATDQFIAPSQWSSGGSPGSPAGRMDNTAAVGYGSSAGVYNGVYRIGGSNSNVINELGASSLTDFTLCYAYLPSSPMVPNGSSTDARQFRLFDFNSGTTLLEVRLAGSAGPRPDLWLNNLTNVAATQAVNATFSARLMDGDSSTIVNAPPSTGGSGSYSAANPEWVFYAVTYHANSPTQTFVEEYGMTATSGGLRKYTSSTTTVGSSTLSLAASAAIDLGSAAFGGSSSRPYDGSFDAFGFYPTVLSLEDIAALGTSAFTPVPEPSTIGLMTLLSVVGVIGGRRKDQEHNANRDIRSVA